MHNINCLIIVLKYLKKIRGFKFLLKRKYYKKLKSAYIEYTPLSKIAEYLSKQNIDCKLFHSSDNILDNYNNIDKVLFDNILNEYKEYITLSEFNGVVVRNNENIDINLIKKYLIGGYFIILPIENNTILLMDYKDDKYTMYNSLSNKKEKLFENELLKYINISFNRHCLMIRKER